MNKIKVLHVIEGLGLGGAEKRLLCDLTFIDKTRFDNCVAYLYGQDYYKKAIENLGVPVYPLNLKTPYQFLEAVIQLCRIIRKNKIDIVHTQLFWANIYARIAAKLTGVCAVLTTYQYADYERDSSGVYSFKRKLIDRFTGLISNSAFIAVSGWVRKSTMRNLGFKKSILIPNSLNFSEYRIDKNTEDECRKMRALLGIEDDDIVLINCGRLVMQKGQRFLVRALPKVLPSYKKVKLIIVGSGPLEEELKRQIHELKIEKNVIFLSNRSDIPLLLCLSDIFIMSSIKEGLSLSLLEAMYMKKICIVTRNEAMTELIEDGKTGMTFECLDPDDIARKILEAINNLSFLKFLGEAAKKTVEQRYNAQNNVRILERTYEAILNHKLEKQNER